MPEYMFPVAASGHDARITASGPEYPPAGAPAVAVTSPIAPTKTLLGGTYTMRVGIAAWDTSSLAGLPAIVSGEFRFWPTSFSNPAPGRRMTAEWYEWQGEITPGDFTGVWSESAGAVEIANIVLLEWNSLVLVNPQGNVNRAGFTALRFHIDGGAPAGAYNVAFNAQDQGTNVPTLVLELADGSTALLAASMLLVM